jgi:lipoprotein-releasing system ATP-binding protein
MSLQIKNLKKSYPNPDNSQNAILDDVNLELSQGQSLAIMGPSGSGKTTLLKIIGLLETINEGELFIDNISCKNINEEKAALFRNEKIGFVFQNHLLLPQCTVIENILMPTLVSKQPNEDYKNKAINYLEKLGLSQKTNSFPTQLSGGECQRVAFIRALIKKPVILLADEPTGALDHDNAENLINLLMDLCHEEKSTLVLATHSERIAERCENKKVLLNGKLN